MKKSEKFIVGVIMVAFIVFLALFSIYESNLTGDGQQDQNISNSTGNMGLFFIENIVLYNHDIVDMTDIVLTKAEHPELNNWQWT